MLTDGLECCGLLVDYCDVFISCLDSHSDGTHSLQRIHCWANDVMLHFSKSDEETNSPTSWMTWEWVYFKFWLNYSFKNDCLRIVLLTRAADKRGVQFSGQQRIRHVSQKLFEQRRHVMNTVPLVQNNIGTLIEGFTKLNVTTNTRQHCENWHIHSHTSSTNEVAQPFQLFVIINALGF